MSPVSEDLDLAGIFRDGRGDPAISFEVFKAFVGDNERTDDIVVISFVGGDQE